MPVNEKYLARFEPGNIYHVYNRTNNHERMFINDENYLLFLNKYRHFISILAETYAWCLLPEHFHLMMKIKPIDEIIKNVGNIEPAEQTRTQKSFLVDHDVNILAQMEFKRLFTAYAMSFNNLFERKGNLFHRTFKRVEIVKDSQFTQALVYIHANAQKHRLVKDFRQYKWTSYHSMISAKPTFLLRDEILDWFGGKEQFIKTHLSMAEHYYPFKNALETLDL